MWIACEIVLKSYLPSELEEGMLFVNRISIGVAEPYIELFELKELPQDTDEFLTRAGAPVELYIIDEDGNIIAEHDEIGCWWDKEIGCWWDKEIGCWWDEENDEFYEFTLDDINFILREHEGMIDVYYDDEEELPVFYDDKIILGIAEEDN